MTRVLVIEDDLPSRINTLELLNAEGFDALGAEDGHVGVQLAQSHLPDLIICDIMMPGLDGYGVLAELRQDPITATIPFIFLTAKTDQVDLRHGMTLGADDYLTKPFKRDELLAAISTRLAKQAAVSKKFQRKLDDLRSNITLALPHELRTPLTGILGFSAILVEDYAELQPDEIREIGKSIRASGERLHRLILNFLLYAELEATARDPERAAAFRGRSTISSRAVITEVAIQKARQASRETDLSLELEEAVVLIEEEHLRKVAEELLDNAFKFSKAGTPVRVTGDSDGHTFTLSIMDSSRGMTAEQIADIGAYLQFERKRREQQGSGLGLVIVKRLAELYEGRLTIESVPGEQTTVRVVLPCRGGKQAGK